MRASSVGVQRRRLSKPKRYLLGAVLLLFLCGYAMFLRSASARARPQRLDVDRQVDIRPNRHTLAPVAETEAPVTAPAKKLSSQKLMKIIVGVFPSDVNGEVRGSRLQAIVETWGQELKTLAADGLLKELQSPKHCLVAQAMTTLLRMPWNQAFPYTQLATQC